MPNDIHVRGGVLTLFMRLRAILASGDCLVFVVVAERVVVVKLQTERRKVKIGPVNENRCVTSRVHCGYDREGCCQR